MTPKGHAIPSKTQLLSYGTPAFRCGALELFGLSTCRPPFPGILRLPTQMCTSLRIPSAAGILRDFGVRVRSSDLP